MDIEKHVKQVVTEVAAYEPKVKSKADYEGAGKALKTVSTAIKMVEAHYEGQKKETYAAYKAVLEQIKELNKPLEVSKAKLKAAMNEYQAKQEQAAIARAAKKGDDAPVKAPVLPDVPGVQTVQRWTWELLDISKVPREFLMLDEKKVNEAVREHKYDAEKLFKKGIRVFQEKSVRG